MATKSELHALAHYLSFQEGLESVCVLDMQAFAHTRGVQGLSADEAEAILDLARATRAIEALDNRVVYQLRQRLDGDEAGACFLLQYRKGKIVGVVDRVLKRDFVLSSQGYSHLPVNSHPLLLDFANDCRWSEPLKGMVDAR